MTLEYWHFDSVGNWNPTFQQLFNHSNDSPFNLTYSLPHQISKVKKIFLKSIEMPIGFTNIRDENNSNELTITVNNIICSIVLTSSNYNINSLIIAINKAIVETNIFTGPNINYLPIFSILGQKVIITVPSVVFTTITLNNTILTNTILGFSYNYQLPSNNITSPSNFNISYDTYLILNFPSINARSSSASNQQISFKIPYNGSGNAIFYNVENQSFGQYIHLTEENTVIGNIKVTISDKFGYLINNNGLDWSFTLAFERDHHHSQQHFHPPVEAMSNEMIEDFNYF